MVHTHINILVMFLYICFFRENTNANLLSTLTFVICRLPGSVKRTFSGYIDMLVTDLFYDFVRILLFEFANIKLASGIKWENISNLIATPSSYLCKKNNCRHEG